MPDSLDLDWLAGDPYPGRGWPEQGYTWGYPGSHVLPVHLRHLEGKPPSKAPYDGVYTVFAADPVPLPGPGRLLNVELIPLMQDMRRTFARPHLPPFGNDPRPPLPDWWDGDAFNAAGDALHAWSLGRGPVGSWAAAEGDARTSSSRTTARAARARAAELKPAAELAYAETASWVNGFTHRAPAAIAGARQPTKAPVTAGRIGKW